VRQTELCVLLLLQVWCVRIVATGAVLIHSCARGRTPRCRRPKRGIWYEYVTKYMVCVCYEVYGVRMLRSICYAYVMKYGVRPENWFVFFENFVFGAANLSSTWEDCSSNARSIHKNNNNAAAAAVKLGFKIFFLFKMRTGSRAETRAKSMESRCTWHGIFTFR
jgi:hypothetical protein